MIAVTVVSRTLSRTKFPGAVACDLVTPKLLRSTRTALIALLLVLFFARQSLALGTPKLLKQYGRQSWQSDTGLPQNTVSSVVQTSDGYLWMATEGGLVRFDGQDLRTFDSGNTREIPSDSTNSLTAGPRGQLWISTSGGLVRRDGSHFTLTTTASGLPSNMVRFTRILRDGRLLVATAGGVAVSDAGGFHALNGLNGDITPELVAEDASGTLWLASGLQLFSLPVGSVGLSQIEVAAVGEIRSIAFNASGDLWIGGRSGLAVLHQGKNVPLSIPGSNTFSVTSLLPVSRDVVWIGTDAGLQRFTRGTLAHVDNPSSVTSGRVLRLFSDREGGVWVAYDLGVSRILPNSPDHLQDPIDIPGVLSFAEDSEGDMWFGTDVGGATILREQAFSTMTTQDGLSNDFIRAVFEDHSGTIWLGTNRGGLNRIAEGKVSAVRAGRGSLSSNVVLALAEAQGDLWIGTADGLSRMHNGRLKLFTTADGLPDDFVRSLYTDTDGSLWIGTRNGLSHYVLGTFTSYSRLDGLGSDLIGSILRDRNGTLWVGTLNGLSRFDGTTFHNLAGNPVTTMAEDHEGTLWVATHASGLARMRQGAAPVTIDSAKAGLPTEIYSILESSDKQSGDSLWLGSSKGIFRVSLSALNAFVDHQSKNLTVQAFGIADGLKISECSSGGHPAAWRLSNGTLWFATLRGAASIRPGEDYQNATAPPTTIEDVLIDDQPVLPDQALIIQPGHDRIAIHFAGLSFRAPQKLRFRYRLEGFDSDWIDAGTRRTAFYTNLPAAGYRFIVQSSLSNGIWSEVPAEFRFTIRPHFYRTIWFYWFVLLFVGLLAWLVYRSRVRIVEAQYQAVLAERTRIAREIHDTLAQGYVGISVQLEVASRLLQVSKEAASKQLESTKEYVRSSLEDARSSIWNLRSPGAESETLPARLASAVRSFQQRTDADPTLRFDVHGTFRPLDRRVEDEILKITQEAMNNAMRHAYAATITVTLTYNTDWLNLTVSDDGKGFDRAAPRVGHYGLTGMHERAAAIGAELVIESGFEAGTTIEVKSRLSARRDQSS